ncbi:MAG TPA: HAMP domain-containing sensor histidine kinase [Pseudomonadales bacterium]|nr:HAMP domain-containing sensor histidine kinase [Pseudomonadales bacterium]
MQKESGSENEIARLRGDLLTMASRVCHDLRTPLGGIVTATEVLRETLHDHNVPETLTQSILDSADELTHLIKQISFITRATAEPLPKKSLPMEGIVAVALQRLEYSILKKQAVIARPDSWPQVRGVAPWLEEVWWIFLTNALEHAPGKPQIELAWREENSLYRFEVCDHGGGVPGEIPKVLFRPFYSLNKPDGPPGFGLSIAQRLIELQGGECGYEPKPGGSCFFFRLPRNGA